MQRGHRWKDQEPTKIDRIALVGDRKWEEWMAKVCKPFTTAKVRYSDISEAEAAWAWLLEAYCIPGGQS